MKEFKDRHNEFEERGALELDEFNAELSGTASGRMERFGVGEDSRAERLEGHKRSKSADLFHHVATAHAYAQIVTFNIGGRDVSMTLGDIRTIAQDQYNHYASKARSLDATAQDKTRMHAYDGLLHLIDDVAAGKASPKALADYIKQHDLDEEILEAAVNDPNIQVADAHPRAAEAAQAGVYTDQSASDRNANFIGNMFGS